MKLILAGSLSFYEKFPKLSRKLEGMGHEIIAAPKKYPTKRKAMKIFNHKIKECDAILVANFTKGTKPNYIGPNTLMEIGQAFLLGKQVFILNDLPQDCKEELEAIKAIALQGNIDKL